MTKAATLTLISDISKGQSDSTAIGRIYDDVVRELGQSDVIVRATLIESVIDQSSYSLPAAAIKRQVTFFDNRILDEMKLTQLMSINHNWRDEKGEPVAVFTEDETEDSFSIYPLPQNQSGSVAGGDFGSSFPTYAITSIHTAYEADLPTWLELPIAFIVLHREFTRESNHRDVKFAEICLQLGILLFSALGINMEQKKED